MTERIKRTFVREEAYLKIRTWILEGTFAPGVQLRDKELALQLGVSRTPIREALLRLEDEGLVETKPNRSTLVTSIDFHSAFHLYSIVWTLEELALKTSFGAITPSHIQAMKEANERFLQKMRSRNRLAALTADQEFHSIYIHLSRNQELEKIITDVKQKLQRLDLYYFDKIKNAELSYDEHQAIIDALEKQDLPLALRALEKNWKQSFARFNF